MGPFLRRATGAVNARARLPVSQTAQNGAPFRRSLGGMNAVDFIHDLSWQDLPTRVRERAQACLLDLIGVAAGGLGTDLSRIIRAHACEVFGGNAPMLFDPRRASPAGVALAGGMTIDALDGHDGYNPAKGHIGCPLLPAILALAPAAISGREALTALAMGYEFGARISVAQHASVADYHTSGSWGAVVAAAAGARLLRLSADQTRHALGIAEYHGPRSQMMRCIDHPSMVKDGSGWGAMAGVSAALLARQGFTGAPAISVEQAPEHWQDPGADWRILDQYFKPCPVCRWAQAPVEGVRALMRSHGLTPGDVARIEVETFHEAVRLATRRPRNTEEAQYSTAFPVALALVFGQVAPEHLQGPALSDPDVLRHADALVMTEHDHANARFPNHRLARVALVLRDGTQVQGDWMTPKWDADAPPSMDDLRAKFHALADPVLGAPRASGIDAAIAALPETGFSALTDLLFQPISSSTTPGKSA
ncbi:MAG: MmgE/PrpD family protein [Marinibacterium sp.]